VPNSVLFPRYSDFRFFFQMAAVRRLNFLNIRNVNCQSASEGHLAKFRAHLSNRCGYMASFRFFEMAAVRHLGFIRFTCIWTTSEEYLVVFVTVQNLFGIGAVVPIISFRLCFASLALKCLFVFHFRRILGNMTP